MNETNYFDARFFVRPSRKKRFFRNVPLYLVKCTELADLAHSWLGCIEKIVENSRRPNTLVLMKCTRSKTLRVIKNRCKVRAKIVLPPIKMGRGGN